MRAILCGLFLLTGAFGFSQREAANWYFGENAGLSFNRGTPEPLLDGQLTTIEGSATISDTDGNLLFYTDGVMVWNKNHELMPNGQELKGSPSGTQTAFIVPNPVDANLYYIFTTDDALLSDSGQFNGFNYSVVDMTLDNGNGDIVEKNNNLLSVGSEKVTGVLNFANNFYWVITHFVDRFYAYRVDGNGVDPNPTVSIVGPTENNFANGRGSLKIAPNATKIAMSYLVVAPRFDTSLHLFDFDANTGIVSNAIAAPKDGRAYYGLEFSSNSKKLYASGVNYNTNNTLSNVEVVQFDLETPNFFSNETKVLSYPNSQIFVAGALQIGLDKRIYHSFFNTRLSVIKNPNGDEGFVNASKFEVELGGRRATLGLPPFIQSFFETIFSIENLCLGETTTFTPEDTTDIVSISWDFGDPDSGSDNISNTLIGEHEFTSTGTFIVTIDVTYSSTAVRQFIEQVEINAPPNVASHAELVQCDVDGIDDGITTFNLMESIPQFSNGNPSLRVSFFRSEAEAILGNGPIEPIGYNNQVSNETVFARVVGDSECFSIVEITLRTEPMSYLGLYDTLYVCDGVISDIGATANLRVIVEQLEEDFNGSDILLFESQTDALLELNVLPVRNYTFDGQDMRMVYFRIENENDCAFIGKVEVVVLEAPFFEENITANLCDGSFELTALEGFENYLWSNGAEQRNSVVFETGIYDVVFSTGTCSYVQTVEVLPTPEIEIEEIRINDFAKNNSITINIGPNENPDTMLYSIDSGLNVQTTNTFNNLTPGVYSLFLDNGCITFGKEVVVGGIQNFFTPNNDGTNDLWALDNPEFFPGASLSIFDRYGKLLAILNGNDSGWDGNYNDRQMPSDSYWYALQLADGRIVKGTFSLKR
ncbi:MAG: T9SS type B sorting domain-containing protein [Bacteroidota bacterium]